MFAVDTCLIAVKQTLGDWFCKLGRRMPHCCKANLPTDWSSSTPNTLFVCCGGNSYMQGAAAFLERTNRSKLCVRLGLLSRDGQALIIQQMGPHRLGQGMTERSRSTKSHTVRTVHSQQCMRGMLWRLQLLCEGTVAARSPQCLPLLVESSLQRAGWVHRLLGFSAHH